MRSASDPEGRCAETPGRFFHKLRTAPPRRSKDVEAVRSTRVFPMEVSGKESGFPVLSRSAFHPSMVTV
jgi:hypothetical protein